MKKLICVLFIAIIAIGCRPKSSETVNGSEIIEIPEQITKSILDVVDNYRLITLNVEDNIDAALSHISKLRVFRDRIYVMDNTGTNKMLVFDKDGGFLKKVSFLGRGPQEYVDLTTFELDYIREELLIKDDYGKKFLVFDLDGNYKRSILGQNIRAGGVAVLSNGNIIYGVEAISSNEGKLKGYKLIICDSENRPFELFCEDNVRYPFGYLSPNFMNPGFDGTVTFIPQLKNEVYRISNTGVQQIYSINFPDMLDREEYEKHNDPVSFNKSSVSHNTLFVGNHADSEDYFCFRYKHNKVGYCAYYNKKDKETLISDDSLCGENMTFDEHGNIWVAIEGATLGRDESEKAREIRDAILKSGNPVIISYNLK